MSEQSPKPFEDWEYETITLGDEPYLEIRGHTPEREIILFSARPSGDRDFAEGLKEFEAGTLGEFPISIDTYLGPKIDPPQPDDDPKDADAYFRSLGLVEEPEPVEHIIYIGHGRAIWDGLSLQLSIPPEVFRDAGASVLSILETEFADIELRIYKIFTLIDPASFQRFLSTLETLTVPPSIDKSPLVRHLPEPTYSRVPLLPNEVISVFRRQDGVISHQQLHRELRTTSRALKGWLTKAELLDAGKKDLTRWRFSSKQLLKDFVPWLRKHSPTYGTSIFVRVLIEAQVIQR